MYIFFDVLTLYFGDIIHILSIIHITQESKSFLSQNYQ